MANPVAAASTALVNLYAPVASSVVASATVSTRPPQGLIAWAMANPVLTASLIAGTVAVFVGCLTLSGVVLSLANSRKESKRDRQHAADEAHKERIATMRREVYMEAVGELVTAQAYLGTLAQQNLTNTNLFSGLQGFQVAASRIAVVAEQATALKARALVGRYNVFLLTALRVILPLNMAKAEVASADKNYADSNAQTNRVLAGRFQE